MLPLPSRPPTAQLFAAKHRSNKLSMLRSIPVSAAETKVEFPMGDPVASSTTTCTQFNGGSTASSMRVEKITDNCELILFNDDASDANPQSWLGMYAPAQGTPCAYVSSPHYQETVGRCRFSRLMLWLVGGRWGYVACLLNMLNG